MSQLADSEALFSSQIQVFVHSDYILHIEIKPRYMHYFFANSNFLLKETLTCDRPSVRLVRGLGLAEPVWVAVPGDALRPPQAA